VTPEARTKVIFALDTLSNDPRASEATRKNAERHVKNQRLIARYLAKQAREERG
jgi:hypothetical protein